MENFSCRVDLKISVVQTGYETPIAQFIASWNKPMLQLSGRNRSKTVSISKNLNYSSALSRRELARYFISSDFHRQKAFYI